MTRGEEALAYIPAELAAGGRLAPAPPLDEREREGAWVEARLHLLDYVQVGRSRLGPCHILPFYSCAERFFCFVLRLLHVTVGPRSRMLNPWGCRAEWCERAVSVCGAA
jgi:hypothetical protein